MEKHDDVKKLYEKVRHFYLAVVHNCHLLDLSVIVRVFGLNLKDKTAVDFLNDLVNAREQAVLGYGNNVVNSLRIWDAEAINTFNLDSFVVVHQNAHQLRYRERRVRIVHLEAYLLVKLFHIIVLLHIFLLPVRYGSSV